MALSTRTAKMHGCLFALILAFVLRGSSIASAATLRIAPSASVVHAGSEMDIAVVLDAGGERINAVSGEVVIPEQWEIVSVVWSGSVLTHWVEPPRVNGRHVAFAGVVPGGFDGEDGRLMTVRARAVSDGSGDAYVDSSLVLLDDGRGTSADVSSPREPMSVSPSASILLSEASAPDTYPPEPFEPVVVRDPALLEGKRALIFLAQDKVSGIDRYEVCEGGRPCAVAQSPYELLDQSGGSSIVIRAIDRAGNVREETIDAVTVPPTKTDSLPFDILALLAVPLTALACWGIWKNGKSRR